MLKKRFETLKNDFLISYSELLVFKWKFKKYLRKIKNDDKIVRKTIYNQLINIHSSENPTKKQLENQTCFIVLPLLESAIF